MTDKVRLIMQKEEINGFFSFYFVFKFFFYKNIKLKIKKMKTDYSEKNKTINEIVERVD